jgi:hypothetical protein
LQLIEDYQKLPGVDSLTGSKTHSADLLLETVLAALPHTKQKMQKEQSIDFGTIVEYLKQIFKRGIPSGLQYFFEVGAFAFAAFVSSRAALSLA